jgi:hypothetical protein
MTAEDLAKQLYENMRTAAKDGAASPFAVEMAAKILPWEALRAEVREQRVKEAESLLVKFDVTPK